MTTTICPGCGETKSRRAVVCSSCRKRAGAVGVSVITNVHDAIPLESTPARPRTAQQNTVFHGRLRELALLEHGGPIGKDELYAAERAAKKRAIAHAAEMFGKTFESSTDLSEMQMERLNDWLSDRIDELRANRAPATA